MVRNVKTRKDKARLLADIADEGRTRVRGSVIISLPIANNR